MKKFSSVIAAIAVFLCYTSSYGQAPAIEWQKSLGGTGTDGFGVFFGPGTYVKQTADNGYLVGGSSQSSIGGLKSENSYGGWDYWVVKLDASRNIVWQKTFGGGGDEFLYDLNPTSDGGCIIAGRSGSGISGNKTEAGFNPASFPDMWIIKTDAIGGITWQRTLGGSGSDAPKTVKQTPDGGYIIGAVSASQSFSQNAIGNKTSDLRSGSGDFWVVKLDAGGGSTWQADYSGPAGSQSTLNSLSTTSDGGFILAGTYGGFATGNEKSEPSRGGNDYWIVKINATGGFMWDKTLGGGADDRANSIVQTSDGGYIVVGESTSLMGGDKTEDNIGVADYWVLKLTSTGAITWQNNIGGFNDDYGKSVEQTLDGGYIVGGFSNSATYADKTFYSSDYDYWLVKMTAQGNIVWNKTIHGAGDDYSFQVHQTADGGFLVAGCSTGGNQYDKNEASYGNYDYWIVKLSGTMTAPNISPGSANSCEVLTPVAININGGNYSSDNQFLNPAGGIVAKVNANGGSLNNVTVSDFVNTGAVRVTSGGQYYLDRSITITPAVQPLMPATIKLYILQTELNALIAQPGSGITSVNDLHLYKNDDACQSFANGLLTEIPILSRTAFANGWQLEANVSAFSSFYFASAGFILPLNLLSFNAYRAADGIQVKWSTGNEINTAHFEIAFSTDGNSFETLNTIVAHNQPGSNKYEVTDNRVLTAEKLYYRLKMVNKDGTYQYSAIVLVNNSGKAGSVIVYPNPTSGTFTVASSAAIKQLRLTDAGGRVVWQQQVPMALSVQSNLTLPSGNYLLQTVTATGVSYQKMLFK